MAVTEKPRLTPRLVEIKDALDGGASAAEVATKLGVSRAAIYNAKKRIGAIHPDWESASERSSARSEKKAAAPEISTEPVPFTAAISAIIHGRMLDIRNEMDVLSEEFIRLQDAEKALAT